MADFKKKDEHVSLTSVKKLTAEIQNELDHDGRSVTKIQNRTVNGINTKEDGTNFNLSHLSHVDENKTKTQSTDDPNTCSKDLPLSSCLIVRVWVSCILILSIYVISTICVVPVSSQYFFYRYSQDYHNETAASTKSNQSCEDDSQNDAQRDASTALMFSILASNIPAFFVCFIIGSASDFLGRKFLLTLPIVGSIINTAILTTVVRLNLQIPYVYIGAAAEGFTGSIFVISMVITAIVSDITLEGQNKALRFAIIDGTLLICGALTQLAVGYAIEYSGFFLPVLVCSCLLCVALLVAIFLLPETLKNKQDWTWNVATHVKKTFGFYFSEKVIKNGRLLFIIGLVAHFTIWLACYGRLTMETIYVLGRPICWSPSEIGIFNAARMVVMLIAAVVLLELCKNRLSLEVTGIICGISTAAGFILEGFADNTLMMYMSGLVGILFTASIPLPKSILSQIASPDKQGALFSGLSCVEIIGNILSSIVFTQIYNATLDTFRGAIFMVMAGIYIICIILLGIFRYFRDPLQVTYETEIKDSSST